MPEEKEDNKSIALDRTNVTITSHVQIASPLDTTTIQEGLIIPESPEIYFDKNEDEASSDKIRQAIASDNISISLGYEYKLVAQDHSPTIEIESSSNNESYSTKRNAKRKRLRKKREIIENSPVKKKQRASSPEQNITNENLDSEQPKKVESEDKELIPKESNVEQVDKLIDSPSLNSNQNTKDNIVKTETALEKKKKIVERKRRISALAQKNAKSRTCIRADSEEESSDNDEEEDYVEENVDDKLFEFDEEEDRVSTTRKVKEKPKRKGSYATGSLDDFIVPDDVELSEYGSSEFEEESEGENEEENKTLHDSIEFDEEGETQSNMKRNVKPQVPKGVTHQSMKESYKIMTQYLLSCLLDEEFESLISNEEHDTYFTPAVCKVFSTLDITKASLVSSSVWSADFISELTMFPIMKYSRTFAQQKCDICRRGHNAAFRMQFLGEPIDQQLYNSYTSGNIVYTKSEPSKPYNIGVYCFGRVAIYHIMHHYKYYLLLCFQKLIDKIKNERDVENEKIIEKIMEDSTVETLYQGFNYLLDVPGDQDGSKVVYYEDLMKAVFPRGILSLGEKSFSYSSSKKSKSNQKPAVYNVLEMVDRSDENEFDLY
jgi:hypothetical protein